MFFASLYLMDIIKERIPTFQLIEIELYTYLLTEHISNIRMLKANFCGREKEGHFHYKNFLKALK